MLAAAPLVEDAFGFGFARLRPSSELEIAPPAKNIQEGRRQHLQEHLAACTLLPPSSAKPAGTPSAAARPAAASPVLDAAAQARIEAGLQNNPALRRLMEIAQQPQQPGLSISVPSADPLTARLLEPSGGSPSAPAPSAPPRPASQPARRGSPLERAAALPEVAQLIRLFQAKVVDARFNTPSGPSGSQGQ